MLLSHTFYPITVFYDLIDVLSFYIEFAILLLRHLLKGLFYVDLKQLEYFTYVVNEGTISAAAKKLNISQPPLSAQMKALEQEFNCTLFERGSRQIQLTEAGRILYRHAINLLEMSDCATKEMNDFTAGTQGTLRIGVTSSVGNLLLDQWIHPFHQKHPNIHYEIIEANTYELLAKLEANLLEVALVRTPFPSHSFECISLMDEPMVAVGAPSFFEKSKTNSISLMQLTHEPIILYRRWEKLIANLLAEENLSWNVLCTNDDARTSIHWANKGLGIAVVPYSALSLAQSNTTIYKVIDAPRLHSSISMIYNQHTYISTISNLFIEYVKTSQ